MHDQPYYINAMPPLVLDFVQIMKSFILFKFLSAVNLYENSISLTYGKYSALHKTLYVRMDKRQNL